MIQTGHSVTQRVTEAVSYALSQGIIVTLASGRMFRLVEPFVSHLGLTSPVICYGGAMIVEPPTRRTIYERGVPLELAQKVIKEARARQLDARAYVDNDVFVDRILPGRFNYESLTRIKAIEVGDLLTHLKRDPSHLAIDSPPEGTRGLVEEMRTRFGSSLHVTTGHPLLVEFSRPMVHKGTALTWLANHLGIPRDQTLAIGDDWNDVEMLRAAGLGVAVANAHPRVLGLAGRIVPSVADDGVAVALEDIVLAP